MAEVWDMGGGGRRVSVGAPDGGGGGGTGVGSTEPPCATPPDEPDCVAPAPVVPELDGIALVDGADIFQGDGVCVASRGY